MINYFHFKKLHDRYLITNDLGRYMFASPQELRSLIRDDVDTDTAFGQMAKDRFFYYEGSKQAFSDSLKFYMRDSKTYLFSATSLHIFVVTNSCNMQCVYCQAQNGTAVPCGMMTKETAKKAVDIALSSPEKHLSFEFQGGEPLLNFDIIRFIVEYTKARQAEKVVDFHIVSNLTLLNDDMLAFVLDNKIGVSTSVDGDAWLHDRNRVYRTNEGTYADVLKSIQKLQKAHVPVGAIQTTTKESLTRAKEIVDTYVSLGLHQVFIRPLTPLGCAKASWDEIGYSTDAFIEFYKTCFDYTIELNKAGVTVKEGHASIMLSKILTGHPLHYMELRSPCGAGVGQIAYYYDGNIYTCDEGRMLAEMGDDSFRLGNVLESSYDDLMNSNNCKTACIASTLESLPNCSDCVYNPYCGTCPVVNLALKQDIFNKEPHDYRCNIYSGIFDILFSALQDDTVADIVRGWL